MQSKLPRNLNLEGIMKAFIMFALATFTFSTFAATTATLNLKGTIDEKMSIEVQNDTEALALDLTVPRSNFKIAEVVEKSNRKAGYKVSISSANGGKLKNGTDDEIEYDLAYDGVALLLDGTDVQTHANERALGTGLVKEVAISYAAQVEEDLVSGDYTDTITFVISAN